MAKSFFRPRSERVIEDVKNNHFFHTPSQRHYQMTQRDERLSFKRYQLDTAGKPINVFEQEVAWILGSGATSRTYLYQTEGGELYQLPLAWYSQTLRWGMAHGFDTAQHQGVQRRVRRECMFYHNAYPNVSEGSDAYAASQVFPKDLPEGLGCQRCHGPGAEHARVAFGGKVVLEQVRATIVNPGRLEPQRRDDVCAQCHLQPTVALPGLRRFGRGDYSYRPGQSLAGYFVHMDIEEAGQERSERFEINHHFYRLRQSPCFLKSQAALNCLTCHDPHRKVPKAQRVTHYRTACLGCHDAKRHPPLSKQHIAQSAPHAVRAAQDGPGFSIESSDCVACHMPRRRTQDVIQVVMTDHLIQRQPGETSFSSGLKRRSRSSKSSSF